MNSQLTQASAEIEKVLAKYPEITPLEIFNEVSAQRMKAQLKANEAQPLQTDSEEVKAMSMSLLARQPYAGI